MPPVASDRAAQVRVHFVPVALLPALFSHLQLPNGLFKAQRSLQPGITNVFERTLHRQAFLGFSLASRRCFSSLKHRVDHSFKPCRASCIPRSSHFGPPAASPSSSCWMNLSKPSSLRPRLLTATPLGAPPRSMTASSSPSLIQRPTHCFHPGVHKGKP